MRCMVLVQILLPLYDNAGMPFPADRFERVRDELTQRFGGVTAYTRSPAEGLWKPDGERVQREDMVMLEVMVRHVAPGWWRAYREELQRRFAQDAIVVRAQETHLL